MNLEPSGQVYSLVKFTVATGKISRDSSIFVYIYIYCESEVITWILPVPLDYVLVVVVGGYAEVSAAT